MANLTGFPVAAPFATSETVGTSVPSPPLGSCFVDGSGNIYMIVDCQEAFVAGEWAVIDAAYAATQITNTSRGRAGIIMAAVTASDTKAYLQVYGVYAGAAGTSDVNTSGAFLSVPATSDMGAVGFAAASTGASRVYGALARTAGCSVTTSPVSSFVAADGTSSPNVGFTVELNFPYVLGTTEVDFSST